MKLAWLLVGIGFFGCLPISSLYPRYRLLVSPLKMMFWNVPTEAEWCLQYLRDRAMAARETILSRTTSKNCRSGDPTPNSSLDDDEEYDGRAKSDANSEQEQDVLKFSCSYLNTPGQFVISLSGLRFEPFGGLGKHESFKKPYSELIEMSKRATKSTMLSPLAKTLGLDNLELKFNGTQGEDSIYPRGKGEHSQVMVLQNMKERDKAFNAVVGFSGLKWQCLQKEPDIDKKPTK